MFSLQKAEPGPQETKRCVPREDLQIQASGEVTHLGKERKLIPTTQTALPFILKNC